MNLKKLIVGNHLWFARRKEDNYIIQAGTVAVVNGDATVTGTGTTFTGFEGDKLAIGSRVVTVDTVTSPTALEMTNVWYGNTASLLQWWHNVDNGIDADNVPEEADWVSLGDIEDANFNPTRENEEVYSPRPGFYSLSERLTKTFKLTVDFTLQDMSELFFEMLMSSRGPIGSGSSGGPFQPYSATGEIRGWFRITQFGHEDTQITTSMSWGIATAQATQFSNAMTKGKIQFECLTNDNNSGVLSLEA